MTTEMIEKVARAIDDFAGSLPETSQFRAFLRSHKLGAARAVLKAMREPTEAMQVSGGLKCEAIMFEGDKDGTGVIFTDIGHVFRAMIDAALKEEGNG